VLRNVILVAVLIAGGIVGYFIGSFSGNSAKDALRQEQQRSVEAKKESEAAHKSLQEKMTALVADQKSSMQVLEKEKSDALAQLESERKDRTKAIQDATASKTATDRRLAELDKMRRSAEAGSTEKTRIEAEMGRLAADNAALQQRIAGLSCGRVPLPKETLQKFQLRTS